MHSNVLFEKIIGCFLQSASSEYFILLPNSLLKISPPAKDQVVELKEKGLFVLPKRSVEFEKKLKEEFTYEIKDSKMAEKYFESVMHGKHEEFNNFLSNNNLSQTWSEHETKYSKNALINWMMNLGIELVGQKLIPEITLSNVDPLSVPDEMKSFSPVRCSSCQADAGFVVKYFKTNLNCENLLMEKRAEKLIKEKEYDNFHFLGNAKKDLIAVSICPKCNSSELEWDFV